MSNVEDMSQGQLVQLIKNTIEYADKVKRAKSVKKNMLKQIAESRPIDPNQPLRPDKSSVDEYWHTMPMVPYKELSPPQQQQARYRFYGIYGTARNKYNIRACHFAYAIKMNGAVSTKAPLHIL